MRILDFNLRIVENIIIVVNILYNFNGLVSFFFLGFRRTTSSLVLTVRQITHGFGRSKVFLHRIGKVLLISSKIASLNLIIIDGPGGQRVI